MLKSSIILVVALTFALFSHAEVLSLKSSAPETYVVKKGDTLWDISAMYLEKSWQWPKLWRWNSQIDNPHLIYPGDVIKLVYDANGEPMLVMEKPKLKWSPQARKTAKKDAVPTLPLSVIRPFLNYEHALTQEQIDVLPRVLGSEKHSTIDVEHVKLYVDQPLAVAERFAIYNKGQPYVDPDTQKILAFEMELVAIGTAIRPGDAESNQPSTLFVDDSRREIRGGDYVLPLQQDQLLSANFMISNPDQDFDGQIIATMSNIREVGTLGVVVLNRGSNELLKAGNIVSVYRKSPAVVMENGKPTYLEDASSVNRISKQSIGGVMDMPTEKIAEAMVFKVYDELSFALITKTLRPARITDKVSN